MFVPIESSLTTYTVHPSARDVASTAGKGRTAREIEFAAVIDAVMNGGDWVVSGFDYASAVGLTATMNAGIAILAGRRVYSTGTFTLTLTGSATNHIYLTWTADGNGNATALGCEVNTTGTPPSTPYLYLATLTTDGSGVTGDTDERQTATPYASLVGGVLIHERGGLEADASAYSDLVKITGGASGEATEGTDYYAPGGTVVPVTDGGLGSATPATARGNIGAAPSDATFITTDGHADLSAEQNVSALADGLLKHASGVLAKAIDGTDFYKPGGVDVALADGGTGASLADPGASDRIMFWDDSAGAVTWLWILPPGISITGTTLALAAPSTSTDLHPNNDFPTGYTFDEVSATEVYRTVSVYDANAQNVGQFVYSGATGISAASIIMACASSSEPTIRVTVACRAAGESITTGGSVNTTTSSTWYPHGGSELQTTFDISGLFTGLASGDLVVVGVDWDSGTADWVRSMAMRIEWV